MGTNTELSNDLTKNITKNITSDKLARQYRNFNVAVYCPVYNINNIDDFEKFDKAFALLDNNVKIHKAYLECFRGGHWISRERLIQVKEYFDNKGIKTSGGITTNEHGTRMGYASLCYSKEEGIETLRNAVKLNAEIFDELIFDDFYFCNCRCNACIEKKGDKSWSEFRLEQKKWVSEEIIMKTAKEINPDINVIIKFPQWYEAFNETGYDPVSESLIFDNIYTGTETRNNTYAQQHLPKYLSYFIMTYLESVAPGRNLGGWFDPYECTYNLTSYLEQAYLTLFGKSKEVTLFCLSSLVNDPSTRLFPPALGELFKEVDEYFDKLGNPSGIVAYRPSNGRGEDNVHNYLGMCGVPLIGTFSYPEDAKHVFLAESACEDKDIISKMQKTMANGGDVVVTSGFVRKMGDAFRNTFVNVSYSSRKAIVNEYLISRNYGLTIEGNIKGGKPILIPQMDYCTNDIWELAGAYGTDNNFPIVLCTNYGEGTISIITIPDDMGDLYNYPAEVLGTIRNVMGYNLPITLDGPAGVMLMTYDNDVIIVRSDLPYAQTVSLKVDSSIKGFTDIVTGREMKANDGLVTSVVMPGVNYVLRVDR